MTTLARPTLTLFATLALGGCVIHGEKWPRPRDLSPAWLVDRTRLLAIRAEPPEIRPGESATFEALLPSPDGDLARIWFACPLIDDAGFGCFLDLGSVDPESMDPDELMELGFIGFEPGLSPSYTAPTDLLDGITEEAERREGVQVLIQVAGLPPELLEGTEQEVDFNEVEMGYKRLVVSEATTPNRNPVIASFLVDRIAVPAGAVVHVQPDQEYDLGVVIDEASRETYEYLNREGVVEERQEEPYATWYATGGRVMEPYTLYPYTESSWIAPDEAGATGTWYAVVRDRRGGMTWWVQPWAVVDAR